MCLAAVKQLSVTVTVTLDKTDAGAKADIQEDALRAFSNLLTTLIHLDNLKLVVIKRNAFKFEPFTPDRILDSWQWFKLTRILKRLRERHGKSPSLFVSLDNIILLDPQAAVNGLVDFISQFEQIRSFSFKASCNRTDFEIDQQSLLRLRACTNIEELQSNLVDSVITLCKIAAYLPTTTLTIYRVRSFETWGTPSDMQGLHFHNLESLHLNCVNNHAAILHFLSHLNAPRLSHLTLCRLGTSFSEFLLGAELRSFVLRCPCIRGVKIDMIPGSRPWSQAQISLESFQSFLKEVGKQFTLSISYWEDIGEPPVAKSNQAVPFSPPLQEEIDTVRISIDGSSIQAAHRSHRVRLPNATKLQLVLGGDKKQMGIVQWFLDGLDLPALNCLKVTVGGCPQLLAPLIAYLPLLPSRCVIQVVPGGFGTASKGHARQFCESEQYGDMVNMCADFGMDLVFEGEHWPPSVKALRISP